MNELDHILVKLLVVRAQAGDDVAFEELVARFHRPLRCFLVQLLGTSDGADDVMQETWLGGYRGIGRLRDPGKFVSWIYQIARNRAMSRLSQDQRWQPLEEPEEITADEPTFSPDDAEAIHRSMERLSPEHREVLLLRFFEQMSYEQMAEVVGCAVGTVRSRLHHAKSNLKQQFEEENHD